MNKLIIGYNHSGFFSNCNIILMQVIKFFNSNKTLPDQIITKDAFIIYKTRNNEDIYNLIFSISSDTINYDNEIKFNDENLENQFSDYKLLKLKTIHPFFTPLDI
jgi:hypothetical protein